VWSSTSTASIRYAVYQSTVFGVEFKNVSFCTRSSSIRFVVDRSTVSGAEVKMC